MIRFVLDASISLGWFVDDPVPPLATRVKERMIAGARALVPALWHLEMANGFANAERRGILSAADVDQSLDQVEQLLRGHIESPGDFFGVRQAFAVARKFRLSAYDAAYLETARLSGLALATLDQQLRDAAARAGVELLA
ncbi:MAG: type II toxin-antitoxin system VapC family toxin [Candidatus Acidiferrales bacterium]